MTSIGSLVRKFNETDRYSREYIAGLQEIRAVASRVGKALANIYLVNSGAVSVLIEAAARLSQKRRLFLTRAITDLPPIFELEGAEIGKELISSIGSLKLSISLRIVPLTEFFKSVLRKPRKEARELGVAEVLRVPLVVRPPLTLETMRITSDYVDRISEINQRAYEATSAVTTRVSVDYARKIPKGTQRVFDITRRRIAEAYSFIALAAVPPAAEAMEKVYEFSKFMSEAPPMKFPVPEAITSRYVVEIPEVSRVPRPIAESLGQVYRVKVLGAMSPFAEAVSAKAARAPSVEVLGVLRRYPTMEAVRRIVRYAPMIADMGGLGYDLVRRGAAEAYAIRSFGVQPRVEIVVIDRLLERKRRTSEIVSRKVAEAYRAGVPIARALPILETIGVIKDHVERVSGIVMRRGVEAYRVGVLSAMLPTAEAMETIREVSGKLVVPALVSPAVAITSRYVLAISEVARVPHHIAERVAEAYGVKVLGVVSPPIKAVGERMAEVRGLSVPVARRARATLLTVEMARRGKHILTVPEIKKVFRLVTERVAEAYRIEVLSLTPPPVEAVTERMMKARGVGISEALRTYPAAEVMEVASALSSEVLRIKAMVSGVMRERYLGVVAGAPPVSMPLAMGTVFRKISEVGKGFELMGKRVRGVSRGVPSVVRPLSAVKTMRAVSSYVSVVLRARAEAAALSIEPSKVLVEGVSRVGLEGVVKGVVGGAVVKSLRADVARYGLERVPLGLPSVVRTVKLHEIIPTLYSLPPPAAPRVRERPAMIKKTYNITIPVRSLEDESDLRSLERKIRRILEREARRYGLS